MPRGGSRLGAGRKADPNSARQKALAKKAANSNAPAGFTLGDGRRTPDAPPAWPFGVAPAAQAPAPAAVPAPAPPEPKRAPEAEPENALAYLQGLYRRHEDERVRMQAAALALPFETSKPLPVKGKGDTRGGATPKASKFASMAAPKLVASNGAKV